VPLTHQLKTGDRVDILTNKTPHPSRDWINPELGYLASNKARAKIQQWYKQQDFDKNAASGKQQFEKIMQQINIEPQKIDTTALAHDFHLKTSAHLLAALACANIKPSQLLQALRKRYPTLGIPQTQQQKNIPKFALRPEKNRSNIEVSGVRNLLTHIAQCCSPIPGDSIIGYITQGTGVSVHQATCPNITALKASNPDRLIDVEWAHQAEHPYVVEVLVDVEDKEQFQANLTSLLMSEKIKALQIKNTSYHVSISIQINSNDQLKKTMAQILKLPKVKAVQRKHSYPKQ
jgi:GTP pyrophosphokinase